ncbi:uncharacterized protein EHS24_000096 [Apiotrichum porosum]|uniref:BTB domain-containing protein n=1 Tax=Apiotrichum porosum TaxID=105984 RepID=A0A427Y978_9TREE|nr:uncharacterized protein EHS24_000096 [Apiotrichum porosum]RSH87585.1 hypothetical protein EHS24_000096 [Apiotrichum porosum]
MTRMTKALYQVAQKLKPVGPPPSHTKPSPPTASKHEAILQSADGTPFRIPLDALDTLAARSKFFEDLADAPLSEDPDDDFIIPLAHATTPVLQLILDMCVADKPFTVSSDSLPLLDDLLDAVFEYNLPVALDRLVFDPEDQTAFLQFTLWAVRLVLDDDYGTLANLSKWFKKLLGDGAVPREAFGAVALHVPPSSVNEWAAATLATRAPKAWDSFMRVYTRQQLVLDQLLSVDIDAAIVEVHSGHDWSCPCYTDSHDSDADSDTDTVTQSNRPHITITSAMVNKFHALRLAQSGTVTDPRTFVWLAYHTIKCSACRWEVRDDIAWVWATRRARDSWGNWIKAVEKKVVREGGGWEWDTDKAIKCLWQGKWLQ